MESKNEKSMTGSAYDRFKAGAGETRPELFIIHF